LLEIQAFLLKIKLDYVSVPIDINVGENVGRGQVWFVFHYTEYYTLASGLAPITKEVLIGLGEKKVANASSSTLNFSLKGNVFFDNVAANVSNPISIPHFSHREIDNFSIKFSVAGSELSTYMEANAPSTTVNQDKPGYTNIIDGVGIFSSRTKKEWDSGFDINQRINYDDNTVTKLKELGLGFCWSISPTATAKCIQL